MAKILEMPKLSPTMEEGVLAAWHKKEGDAIAVDDLLAEVETDKATMEFRAFDKGTLLKILVAPGAKVKLGQPVAILGEPGEDVERARRRKRRRRGGADRGAEGPAQRLRRPANRARPPRRRPLPSPQSMRRPPPRRSSPTLRSGGAARAASGRSAKARALDRTARARRRRARRSRARTATRAGVALRAQGRARDRDRPAGGDGTGPGGRVVAGGPRVARRRARASARRPSRAPAPRAGRSRG